MRLRRSLSGTALCFLFLLFAAGGAGAQEQGELMADQPGPLVSAIEIATDLPASRLGTLRSLIAIEVGLPLAEEDIRRTLTNLHVTGLAGEIEVLSRREQSPAGEAVVVTLVLRSQPQVEKVRISGELGIRRREVEAVVERGVGQPLSDSQVLRGVFALQDFYKRRGYLEAVVRVRVEYLDPEEKQAVVLYEVMSGPRAQVGEVTFRGDLGALNRAALIVALGVETGSSYRPRSVSEAADRLRSNLIKQGFRTATVDGPKETYDPETDRMALSYEVEVGPKVTLQLIGAKQKELEKNELLPFMGPEGFDDALLLESVDRVERFFQEKGHYRAEVSFEEERSSELLKITLRVEPGPIYTLEDLRFDGNEQISDETLTSLAATTPRRLLALGSGRLVDDVLAEDIDNIEAYYALQGFSQAEISPPIISEEGTALRVTVPIREGSQRRVAELSFEGLEALEAPELEDDLESRNLLTSGGPYHPVLVEDAAQYLRARYEAIGYSRARISTDTRWNGSGDRAAVTFRVLEGPRSTIDRVIVRGHRKTDVDVIRRAADLSAGEPASGGVLLSAQRRLYRLGAFSEVEVRFAPADPGAETRDVVVRVEEGDTRRLIYGFGYDYSIDDSSESGPRGLLGYSDLNLLGQGFRLGTDLRISSRENRARISLDQPYVGRFDIPLTYTLFWNEETREVFDVERWGARTEAVRRFGLADGPHSHRMGLIFDYRVVDTITKISETGLSDLDRRDQTIRISSLIPNLLFDFRDDPLDPTRGWTSYSQLQYAFPFLSTTEEFLELFYQHTHYLPLGHFGVLAGSVRAGGIEPLSTGQTDSLLPADQPNSRISIAERFFAGGANSHRAYKRDRLAIPGQTSIGGDPVGGNGLLLINVDYRFPIAGAVGGVVFVDAGNVWADWQDIQPGEMKLGVGLGVRYRSPLGPIRLEVGYKLDPEPGDDQHYRIFLSIGNPF